MIFFGYRTVVNIHLQNQGVRVKNSRFKCSGGESNNEEIYQKDLRERFKKNVNVDKFVVKMWHLKKMASNMENQIVPSRFSFIFELCFLRQVLLGYRLRLSTKKIRTRKMWEEYLVSDFDDVILMIFEDSWTQKMMTNISKKNIQWNPNCFRTISQKIELAETDVWTKHF